MATPITADIQDPCSSTTPLKQNETAIEWNHCVLCQNPTNDTLVCPLNNTQKKIEQHAGYITVAQDIERFLRSEICPFKLHSCLIGESETVAKLLSDNRAKWHKVCRNKICNYKYERALKRKTSSENVVTSEETPKKVTRSNSNDATANVRKKCLFCNDDKGQFRNVSTFEIEEKIRKCAIELNDTILLAKLSAGDLVAQEAVYHLDCLSALYYRSTALNRASVPQSDYAQTHGLALGEIIALIEEDHWESVESKTIPIYKLSDLAKMYNSKINDSQYKVNTTYLKDRILSKIPYLEAHRQGREVMLVHRDSIGDVIKQVSESSYDDKATILSKAASIVRRDIINHVSKPFEGTFGNTLDNNTTPPSLASLVGMILAGSNIGRDSEKESIESTKVRNVSQIIIYNVSESKNALSCKSRHVKQRETPLAIYLGLLIHAETRKKSIIEKFHALGVCISYRRLLEISTSIGNYVSDCYDSEGVVCPLSLKTGIFTTSAVDNIDHNPSSVTAKGSFHGTGISLFQHNDKDTVGEMRPRPQWNESYTTSKYTIKDLPASYSQVNPVFGKLHTDCPDPWTPEAVDTSITAAIGLERRWLEHVDRYLPVEVTADTNLSWAGYHSQRLEGSEPFTKADVDTSTLLPLFPDQAKSPAMIRHSMDIIRKTTNYLNPGQIPVMAADQPLYSLAKQIQWTWPNEYSEDKFVIMFGGLHIEMAALRTVGDLLEDSGWTAALTQANIASPGTTESFIKASSILKTRHAHQVTAASLFRLMKQQYNTYVQSTSELIGPEVCFEMWCEKRKQESPMFMFWNLILCLELTILIFVRSLREGNFQLYVNSLVALVPWFFALDHNHYARWIPIHIKDMLQIREKSPSIATEFEKGHFSLNKSVKRFSAIPLDQAHEQNNKLIKDDGGAVGLTENSSKLLRWMVCGPEVTRLINEFENISLASVSETNTKHHDQTKSIQVNFKEQVNALVAVIQDLGNPFADSTEDLLVLDTRVIVDASVTDSMRSLHKLGQLQYDTFVQERLVMQSKSITDTIKQNKVPLFSRPTLKKQSKQKLEVACLKDNCALFSQLYVSCQIRKGNLSEFFAHENSTYPPSLTQFGDLRTSKKSDLLPCIEAYLDEPILEKPHVDAVLLDGAVVINMLKPSDCDSFSDYAEKRFMNYIQVHLANVSRVDIIWDRYFDDSLKASTRTKRGEGVRRRVSPNNKVPTNWEAFIRNEDNKRELFEFLADKCSESVVPEGKSIISTKGDGIIGTATVDNLDLIAPCSHEEADTRLLLHALHIGKSGLTKATIKTVDTDVVVLAVALFTDCGLDELWIEFGSGKHLRYIPIHTLVRNMDKDITSAMPAFHAFTGCDQVSAFAGKGKKSAWHTLLQYPEAIHVFKNLSLSPSLECLHQSMPVVERFVVSMYDRSSSCQTTDEAREDLFTRHCRSLDTLPPTSNALLQHTKRSVYQGGYCWGQALVASPDMPSPADFGWIKDEDGNQKWQPLWSTILPASKACLELLKCGCNIEKGCRGRCKCVKANLPCTALCKCGGSCDRL